MATAYKVIKISHEEGYYRDDECSLSVDVKNTQELNTREAAEVILEVFTSASELNNSKDKASLTELLVSRLSSDVKEAIAQAAGYVKPVAVKEATLVEPTGKVYMQTDYGGLKSINMSSEEELKRLARFYAPSAAKQDVPFLCEVKLDEDHPLVKAIKAFKAKEAKAAAAKAKKRKEKEIERAKKLLEKNGVRVK